MRSQKLNAAAGIEMARSRQGKRRLPISYWWPLARLSLAPPKTIASFVLRDISATASFPILLGFAFNGRRRGIFALHPIA